MCLLNYEFVQNRRFLCISVLAGRSPAGCGDSSVRRLPVTPDLDKGRTWIDSCVHSEVVSPLLHTHWNNWVNWENIQSCTGLLLSVSPSQGCHWLLLKCGRWLSPGFWCSSARISTKFPSLREKSKKAPVFSQLDWQGASHPALLSA